MLWFLVSLGCAVFINSSGIFRFNVTSNEPVSLDLSDELTAFVGWRGSASDVILNVSLSGTARSTSLREYSNVLVRSGYVEYIPIMDTHAPLPVFIMVFPTELCQEMNVYYGEHAYVYDLFRVTSNTKSMCLFVGDGPTTKLKLENRGAPGVTFTVYDHDLKPLSSANDSITIQSQIALAVVSPASSKTVELELTKTTTEHFCDHSIVPIFDSNSMQLALASSPFVVDELTCEERASASRAVILVFLLFIAVVLFTILFCCASIYCFCTGKRMLGANLKDGPKTVNIQTNDARDQIPEIVEEDEPEHMATPLIQSHEL